ncbi:hypothetical protein SRRS_27030 [Sporomusa rhizae]|uniref:DUF7768 domain-containing protein n=1 Tax=Sporomusa rhizae TaxID=357999 RepID=UPI00352BB735
MKKVYIAHPLRGDIASNIDSISHLCRNIIDTDSSILPLSPVLAFSFFDPDKEPVKAMQYCLELLRASDELWVYGDWKKSEGCLAEVAVAKCNNIPIKFKSSPAEPQNITS